VGLFGYEVGVADLPEICVTALLPNLLEEFVKVLRIFPVVANVIQGVSVVSRSDGGRRFSPEQAALLEC
jgi:hypothetical protein